MSRISVFLVLTGAQTQNRYVVYNELGQQVYFMQEGTCERISALNNRPYMCVFAVRCFSLCKKINYMIIHVESISIHNGQNEVMMPC